jgi:hypothetical protein
MMKEDIITLSPSTNSEQALSKCKRSHSEFSANEFLTNNFGSKEILRKNSKSKFHRMTMVTFVLLLLSPSLIHCETEADISLMYYDYSGSTLYESGTYGSARVKQTFGKNNFTFFAGNQSTKGKTGLQSLSYYDYHEIWTDSVYYHYDDSTLDTIFVNTFLDTTYTVTDTTDYDIADIIQNEFLISYQRKINDEFSADIKLKYTEVENSYLNEALLLGIGCEWALFNVNVTSDISYSKMQYTNKTLSQILDETIIKGTTYIDTLYEHFPDSIVTTGFVFNEYSQEEEDEWEMISWQLYNSAFYVLDRLLIGADFAIYKIFDSEIYNEDPRIFYGVNSAYYWDHFSIFGGYSRGDKNLLNTFGNTYLNVANDEFIQSGNVGLAVYPLIRNWSVSYEFGYSEFQEKDNEFSINSHLVNLFYKF